MFRFEDPQYLYALLLIPLLAVLHFLTNYRRRKRLKKFGDPDLVKTLMPDASVYRLNLKMALLWGALALMILMAARPQFGTKVDTSERKGIEAIIAMDISNSMLCEDITPSRLERAKMMMSNLVDKMENDKVGLIVFAGDAFTQLPITNDYVSAKMFLDEINPGLIRTQGTDIRGALSLAEKSFTPQQGVDRAVIIITDGENHEGDAVEQAKELASKGIHVYVLGIGSPEGAPIPVPGQGGYKKDLGGQTVITHLNETMCQQIAQAGGGAYIHVDNTEAAQELLNAQLDKLAKKTMQTSVYSEFDEQFQAFAILTLLVLIIEILVQERRGTLFNKLKLFK